MSVLRPGFLHSLQLKQYIVTGMRILLSIIKPGIRDLQQCKTIPLFSVIFLFKKTILHKECYLHEYVMCLIVILK